MIYNWIIENKALIELILHLLGFIINLKLKKRKPRKIINKVNTRYRDYFRDYD